MSTTTIRLPVELKARVADAARRSGTTPHGFILAAIAEKTDADERRAEEGEKAGRPQALAVTMARIESPRSWRRFRTNPRTPGRKRRRRSHGSPSSPW